MFPKLSTTAWLAALLLSLMGLMAFSAASQDALTTDESPHIVAGYSYLKFQEYRINPEHPPLAKDIAALPLIFQKLNFPKEHPSWAENINDQWTLGPQFLFYSGNNPDQIIKWARVGPIVIMLLLGAGIFLWARQLFGNKMAILALLLYSLSPTFLAHGRLVTTDVPAAAAFFGATFFFLRYLRKQSKLNLIWAGLAFGVAQLTKFSLILLVPYFVILALLWILWKDKPLSLFSLYCLRRIFSYAGKLILIGLIGLALVYPVYQFHIQNYTVERQAQDTAALLGSSPYPTAAAAVEWMADKPYLRAYAQFFLGQLMVFQRVSGGNTVYFLGEVASTAWWYYFPVVFFLKIPIALLVLLGITSLIFIKSVWRNIVLISRTFSTALQRLRQPWRKTEEIGEKYFPEIAFVIFVLIYWTVSMKGNLNIGIRHILPTLPFLYLLIAGQLQRWLNPESATTLRSTLQTIFFSLGTFIKKIQRGALVIILLIWYIAAGSLASPHFLSYFNELAGGSGQGYRYVVDSNLDWGQDLKRLAYFVEKNNIKEIKLDYFGGDSPSFRLGKGYKKLNPFAGPQKGWVAVSATLLQNGRGRPAKGFDQSTTHYMWLNNYEPVQKIGNSIFVYNIRSL